MAGRSTSGNQASGAPALRSIGAAPYRSGGDSGGPDAARVRLAQRRETSDRASSEGKARALVRPLVPAGTQTPSPVSGPPAGRDGVFVPSRGEESYLGWPGRGTR